jgi:tetratricopeptide (TPR) repeat protein
MKKTLYIDMDNVLVDFRSGMAACDPALLEQFKERPDEIPGIFGLMQPKDGAIAAYQDGRLQDALSLTDAALLVDPRNPRLRFLRGVILTETQQPQAASDIFRSMIRDFPELPEPYNNLAVIQAAAGDLDGARQSLEQSIIALPSYAMARENLGDLYLQLAIRAYEEAGRLDTGNPSARRKLSITREIIVKLPSAAASTPPRSRAQP